MNSSRVLFVTLAVLLCGIAGIGIWTWYVPASGAPQPSASPVAVPLTEDDVKKIINVTVTASTTAVRRDLAALSQSVGSIGSSVTALEKTVGNDSSGIVADVKRLDEREYARSQAEADFTTMALRAAFATNFTLTLTVGDKEVAVSSGVKDGKYGFWLGQKHKPDLTAILADLPAAYQKWASDHGYQITYPDAVPQSQINVVRGHLHKYTGPKDRALLDVSEGQEVLPGAALQVLNRRIRGVNERVTDMVLPDDAENGAGGVGHYRSGSSSVATPASTVPANATAPAPTARSIRARRVVSASPATSQDVYERTGNTFRIRKDLVARECGSGTPYFLHAKCAHCTSIPGGEGWGRSPMREDGDYWVADCPVTVGSKCNVWVEGGEYFPDHRHVGQADVLAHNPIRSDTGAWLVLR